jgi:hypothetical protein
MPDRTRFTLDGQSEEYGKGRTVLEVVRKYVGQHPEATFDEVRQVFPDDLQGTYHQFSTDGRCVIKRLKDVKDEKRFHVEEKDRIEIMGEPVVVSREWNIENFNNFIEKARELGFEIEKVVN